MFIHFHSIINFTYTQQSGRTKEQEECSRLGFIFLSIYIVFRLYTDECQHEASKKRAKCSIMYYALCMVNTSTSSIYAHKSTPWCVYDKWHAKCVKAFHAKRQNLRLYSTCCCWWCRCCCCCCFFIIICSPLLYRFIGSYLEMKRKGKQHTSTLVRPTFRNSLYLCIHAPEASEMKKTKNDKNR